MTAPAAAVPADADARRRAVAAAAVVALLAFVPALHGGFVYDDHRFLERNAQLGDPSILWRAFADPASQTADDTFAGLWRPLRTLSFALDRALFGASPFGPHAVNVALHAAGAALVAALLLAWRVPALAAALGAAVYAVHPVQAECVAWISSRGDLLAAAGVWAALLLDLRGRPRAALALGAAALLAKEQAVVWPLFVPLSRRLAGARLGDAVRAALGPAAVTGVFLIVRWALLREPLQQGGLGAAPSAVELGSMFVHQAWTAVLPGSQAFDWQMPRLDRPPAAVLPVVVACGAALLARPTRIPAALFLAGIAPTWALQAFVPLNIRVADRFLLFSLPALALAAALGAARHRGAAAAVAVAAAALLAQTEARIPSWSSDETLWGSVVAREPGHWRGNAWLGEAALGARRWDDAERRLGAAARAAPGDARTRYGLARAQECVGILRRDPDRLGAALGNYATAAALFTGPRAEGAAARPDALWAEPDLLLMLGRLDDARAAIRARLDDGTPVPRERGTQLAARAETLLDAALAAEVRARIPSAGTSP